MCAALENETAMSKMLFTLFAGVFAISAFAVEAPKTSTPAAKPAAAAPAVVTASAPVSAPKKAVSKTETKSVAKATAGTKKTEKMAKHGKASAKAEVRDPHVLKGMPLHHEVDGVFRPDDDTTGVPALGVVFHVFPD